MEYKGKLYGRVGEIYFPLMETSEDVERMKKEIIKLEGINQHNGILMRKMSQEIQGLKEELYPDKQTKTWGDLGNTLSKGV